MTIKLAERSFSSLNSFLINAVYNKIRLYIIKYFLLLNEV